MSDNTKKIESINYAIKKSKINQEKVVEDMISGKIKKEDNSKFLAWQSYGVMITNLKTQKYVLESIRDTDKITILAYRVALINPSTACQPSSLFKSQIRKVKVVFLL